jgi:hypothetical protein
MLSEYTEFSKYIAHYVSLQKLADIGRSQKQTHVSARGSKLRKIARYENTL